MKNFLLKSIRKILKTIKINPLLICSLVSAKPLKADNYSLSKAMDNLEKFSPNPQTSCISQNHISNEVDLHIIVPAYNAERYIEACVNSVINPPKAISFILTIVNDGSTDKTPQLLKKYESIANIEIINQSNKGFSGARNAAIKNIKGRYITFLDSDDKLDWSTIEKMIKLADDNDLDMVQGDFYYINENDTLISNSTSHNCYTGYPCGKIFKSHLFKDIIFPENYWFEDTIIEQIIFAKIHTKTIYDKNSYYYRIHSKSISRTMQNNPKSIDSLYVTLQLHKDRVKLGLSNTKEYYDFILRMMHLTYYRVRLHNMQIVKSIFLVFSKFIIDNFNEFNTSDLKLKPIEQFIRNGNFTKWLIYCLLTDN